MSDSRDPYTVPPAPERFDPPTPADSGSPSAPPPTDPPDAADPPAPHPYEMDRRDDLGATEFTHAHEERVSLGPPALEPLPAMAGDFATATSDAANAPSLTSRLIDEF